VIETISSVSKTVRAICFGAFLLLANQASAQVSISSDPALVLRDALAAACSQNDSEFARALTLRNSDSFSHMTSTARSTLLKRFVLLNESGKPAVKNDPSGRILILCSTPGLATQLELDKPEIRDNLAYIPLTVRDANDSNSENLRRVTMGMVRENGEWKILSLGLLLLDLPSLENEWDRAEVKSNEQSAIQSMKAIVAAIESYRKTYTRIPDTLVALGPPTNGSPKADAAGLIDQELARGRKNGYLFRYVIVGANNSGAPAKYELAAIPAEYSRTGVRSFFCDSSIIFHAGDHKGAIGSSIDPKLDESQYTEPAEPAQ